MLGWFKQKQMRIYLDHAAATPLDVRVRQEMEKYQREHFGNPGSPHKEGIAAHEAMQEARTQVARFFSAHSDEVLFTSSGTEANNLAIQGTLKAQGSPLSELHVITTAIEHPSVRDVFKHMEKEGLSVTYVPVSESGHIDAQAVKDALQENTALVSIIHASNEIGTVQPIRDIAKEIRRFRKEHKSQKPLLHIDACQTANFLDINVEKLGVDLASVSSSKVYGPKGVGILYARRGASLEPILWGGGQELGKRAGTENVAGIVGAGEAFEVAAQKRSEEFTRLQELRDYFRENITKRFPEATHNGDGERVPNVVNVSFSDAENEELVLRLDARGIACSTRSACQTRLPAGKAGDEEASYVVKALGAGHNPHSAVRFSMGRGTTKRDVDYTLDALGEIFKTIKANF